MTIESPGRRRFLAAAVQTIHGAIGAVVAYILGRVIVAPSLAGRSQTWLPAASLGELTSDEPTPVMLRVARQDGYSQVVDRQVVFVVKVADTDVRVLSSTCTHLGCRVSWDAESKSLKCPCHGGVYDRTGKVIAGPPPAPLATLVSRIEGDRILVQV